MFFLSASAPFEPRLQSFDAMDAAAPGSAMLGANC
jgi:hypothetical protein